MTVEYNLKKTDDIKAKGLNPAFRNCSSKWRTRQDFSNLARISCYSGATYRTPLYLQVRLESDKSTAPFAGHQVRSGLLEELQIAKNCRNLFAELENEMHIRRSAIFETVHHRLDPPPPIRVREFYSTINIFIQLFWPFSYLEMNKETKTKINTTTLTWLNAS